MEFSIKRDALLKSLNLAQGIIEKKNTLPILSNVLLKAQEDKLFIIATDLDIVFYDTIDNVKVSKKGETTTSATVLYDILRKISSNSEVYFSLKSNNQLSLRADNSDFNLKCLPADNFPNFAEEFNNSEIILNKSQFLSLINKTKISISNDDTRHYLNGIFMHLTDSQNKSYLTAVATDSHRLSSSSIEIEKGKQFASLILPKKTVYQLSNLLQEAEDKIFMLTSDTKIQFKIGNTSLVSKIIDGKFPDYRKVVPTGNNKNLTIPTKDFTNSIERVIAVSIDKKEGVKLVLNNNSVRLSVNSTNSGEGNEVVKANYSGEELTISFNSKYLIDIASEVQDKNIKMNLKDSVSPVLIEDLADKNSYYVIMPMKI